MARGQSTLYIDVSDLQKVVDDMKLVLSEEGAKRMLRDTISNTGRKVKSIIGQEVPKKYEAKRNWVTSQVGKPQNGGAGDLSAIIPINGVRGIDGGRFPATGGTSWAHPSSGGKAARRERRIRVKILKGKANALPETLPHQGGQPPFRNVSSKLGSVVFTRKTNKPYPIARVAGLSVPQMPMNKSKEEITKDIYDYMEKELERNFARMLK